MKIQTGQRRPSQQSLGPGGEGTRLSVGRGATPEAPEPRKWGPGGGVPRSRPGGLRTLGPPLRQLLVELRSSGVAHRQAGGGAVQGSSGAGRRVTGSAVPRASAGTTDPQPPRTRAGGGGGGGGEGGAAPSQQLRTEEAAIPARLRRTLSGRGVASARLPRPRVHAAHRSRKTPLGL